jgi:hypothetical protein
MCTYTGEDALHWLLLWWTSVAAAAAAATAAVHKCRQLKQCRQLASRILQKSSF